MKTLDVNAVINTARFTRFHWMVICLCALLLIFDGYDLFIFGVVLPTLMKEWSLTPVQAGALGSYALFGMMFGAFVFGPLADRIGRKKGILISFVLFSCATVISGFASSATEFGIFRFIAGLGCGGLMPNAVALMNEYAPKRSRSTLVAIMFSGYSLGGVLCAGLGIFSCCRALLQSMSRRRIATRAAALIVWKLPESVGFMLRQGKTEQALDVLHQVDPQIVTTPAPRLVQSDVKPTNAPMLDLLKDGRLLGTPDDLAVLLLLPADGVCPELVAAQTHGQCWLQPRFEPILPADAEFWRRCRCHCRWLAGGSLQPAQGRGKLLCPEHGGHCAAGL